MDIRNEITLDESPLENFDLAEVYTELTITNTTEVIGNYTRSFEKKLIGTAVRSFNKRENQGFLYVHDGVITNNNWFKDCRVIPIPYSKLPQERVNEEINHTSLCHNNIDDIFAVTKMFFEDKGLILDSLYFQK